MKPPAPLKAAPTEVFIALGLTALLAVLHVVVLFSAGPLWRDEVSTLSLATKPTWDAVWAAMVYDPFPLQYIVLLRGWSALVGNADFSLRVLGCLIGLACLGSLWLSTRLSGQRSPILALAIFAFSPTLITWGDTLRAYGLGVCWIIITFGCFVRHAQRPSLSSAAIAALTAILSVQAMFTNALLVFSIGMAACAIAARKRDWRNVIVILAIGLLAGLSLIPYKNVLQAGQGWAQARKEVAPFAKYLHDFQASLQISGTVSWWIWLGLILSAAALALWWQRKAALEKSVESSNLALFGFVAGGLGFFATLIFFKFLSWPTHVWYYLPCLAIIALSVDLIFASTIASSKGTLIRVSLALAAIFAAFSSINTSVQTRASNLDIIALILQKTAAPQDLIVLNPFTDGITFQRYYHGSTETITAPIMHDLTIHRWDEVVAQARDPKAMQLVLDKVDQTLRSGRRIWLVSSFILSAPSHSPPPPRPLQQADSRSLLFFQSIWSNILAYELTSHSTSMHQANFQITQPVSLYENSQLFQFSGWKETP